MDKAAVLVMENVTKQYKKKTIVDSFHLAAHEGELVALVGPNGAGKSTIIKMICGMIRPTSGTIHVKGRSLRRNRKQYAEEISYMPDHFHFHQPLTVKEFLMYYASLRRTTEQRVTEALERVGLLDKSGEYTSTLSKGMGQRLLLAQTLISNASLILLDEPTNGLDKDWLGNLEELLLKLKADNKTVLFSTHLDSFAESVSDRVVEV